MEKWVSIVFELNKIANELSIYRYAESLFGCVVIIRHRELMAPAIW